MPVSYYYVGPGSLDGHQSLSIDLSPAGRDPAGEEEREEEEEREKGEYIIINLRSDPRGYPRVSTRDSLSKAVRTGVGEVASHFGVFWTVTGVVNTQHR